ncbi:uncharacterized protein LOC100374394 [Saccoglossus kowalevskii]|uniref:Prostate stem cell antigen-like n=1 Tax=Saccoglossus kowalevskii TaxID=10224 RepID=A0ABM0GYU1_SACKO|nr:PREDICTED: prostate stem cell antigen-like [Saccoglossus kowalevskii]
MAYFSIFIYVACLAMHSTLSLQCYQCNELTSNCLIEYGKTVTACRQENPKCQITYIEERGQLIMFARDCAAPAMCYDNCEIDTTTGNNVCQHCCDTNLCNHGNALNSRTKNTIAMCLMLWLVIISLI